MSNIFIVGKILNDTYLNLDPRTLQPEIDQDQTPWLDLPLNGSSLNYLKKTTILGGVAVTAEPLLYFGHQVELPNATAKLTHGEIVLSPKNPPEHRYICSLNHHIFYLSPSHRSFTDWQIPTSKIDWIFIDASAHLSPDSINSIKSYLAFSTRTALAIFCPKNPLEATKQLLPLAQVIFTTHKSAPNLDPAKLQAQIFHLTDQTISHQDTTIFYHPKNPQLTTHLTLHNLIAGTILSALLENHPPSTAMELAKLNAENSTLDKSLTKTELLELLKDTSKKADITLIAKSLMQKSKGILAADESGGSIHKKFTELHIPDTAKNRRDYRNLFFSTENLANYINGVILFEETAHQLADNHQNFTDFLTAAGIIPGIKVDQGLAPLTDLIPTAHPTEVYTKGLDDLGQRLENYYQLGLRFAKWRAAFYVSDHTPSADAININTDLLAQYAKKCQDAHIVPIVEPELVHDGNYDIHHCANLTGQILDQLFISLTRHKVQLEACILKCNMVLAGKQSAPSTPEEVGHHTAEVLLAHVPKQLAGIVFLSGGQTPTQSTQNLQAIIKAGQRKFPWPLTFSFARALQEPALKAWQGQASNVDLAKQAFKERLIANTNALKP